MLNRFRRRFDAAVERRVDSRVDARVDEVLETLARSREDYEARLAGTQADFSYIRSEFDRIAPQLAALEQRFEWLRSQVDVVEPEAVLVRARAEHERARLRLELASHYEERLRRLEEQRGE